MILDLFAGPGGWSEGARSIGALEIGIEWDAAACSTRAAAGHTTIRANVAEYPTAQFAGKVSGLIASPPCPTFSNAGKGEGMAELAHLHSFAEAAFRRGWFDPWSHHQWADRRTPLVLEPLRWADALKPDWIALEQVPPVMPLWEQYAAIWQEQGYSVWAGVLNAADFGVPQTRRRAFVLASRVRTVSPPEPTHCQGGASTMFGELLPWVSMASALGWTGEVGFPRLNDRGDSPDGYRERDWRGADEPAFNLTEKAWSWVQRERSGDRSEEGFDPHAVPAQCMTSKTRSWTVRTGANSMKHSRSVEDVVPYERPVSEPAPTVDQKAVGSWTLHRPATTLAGDSRVFTPGGHIAHDGRDNTKMKGRSEDAIKITLEDALVLQSFDRGYPVQGSRTKQFEQVGNAVPPALARVVLERVVSDDFALTVTRPLRPKGPAV